MLYFQDLVLPLTSKNIGYNIDTLGLPTQLFLRWTPVRVLAVPKDLHISPECGELTQHQEHDIKVLDSQFLASFAHTR